MKKLILLFAFASSSLIAFSHNVSASNGPGVDTEKSKIEWVGKKVLGQHNGVISIKSGEIKHDNGRLSGGSFVIDMTTIEVQDLEGNMKNKLEGHLKSPDFFDVANHQTATFVITEVKPAGKGKYNITGDLTIKGITNPISFTAASVNENNFQAEISVDRTLYDVRYGSGKFFDGLGDNMIDDHFELTVNLVTG